MSAAECRFCGAPLEQADRVCFACGRLVAAEGRTSPWGPLAEGATGLESRTQVAEAVMATAGLLEPRAGPALTGSTAVPGTANGSPVPAAQGTGGGAAQGAAEGAAQGAGEDSLGVEVRWGNDRYPVTVPPAGCTFGSTAAADVVVPATFLAPVHARIERTGTGWLIRACSAEAVVVARGEAVHQAALAPGDVVRLGDLVGNFATLVVAGSAVQRGAPGALRCALPAAGITLVLGSAVEADVRLIHPLVRPRHARLRRDSNGVLWLEDRASVAGSYVNGARLRGRCRVSTGDTVQIGPFSALVGPTALEPIEQVAGVAVSAVEASVTVAAKRSAPKTLLAGVNLELPPGSLTAIAGPSGAGKSTLMRLLSGQLSASGGSVRYNGVDLTACRQAYASLAGFVPQDDVVHADLTVTEALAYQASLRLGKEVTQDAREAAVARVIGFVGLAEHKNQLVRTLSGGQRKRVSIATELLNDPKILFLDEPTSGLDPGLDKRMMLLLRLLADQGRTVILTTHAITHVDVCDTLVVVGPGGRVIFAGPPAEATGFFDVQTLGDVFSLIDTPQAAERAARRHRGRRVGGAAHSVPPRIPVSPPSPAPPRIPVSPGNPAPPAPVGSAASPASAAGAAFARPALGSPAWREMTFYQGKIFAGRHLRLLSRDRSALALSLGQGVAVGSLTALVAHHPLTWAVQGNAPMFVFGCAAVWFGMVNAVRELVKERTIWQREHLAGASVHSYLFAKVIVLAAVAAFQAVTTVAVVDILLGMPPGSPGGAPLLSIAVTLWLATFSGTASALVVSALAPSSDRAMTVVPYLLVTQLVLCGVLFPLGSIRFVSWLMPAHWTVSSLGAVAGLSARALHQTSGLYPHSFGGLLFNWVLLAALSAAGLAATTAILRRQAASWSVG